MKKTISTVSLLLVLAAGMLAAERRNIADVAEKVDRASAKARWAAADAGLNSLTFPQAAGFISVQNGTQVDFNLSAVAPGSYVVGEIIDPSGEMISTDTYYIGGPSPASVYMELWNGPFPGGWPSGITRFRGLVQSPGGITEANVYVAVRSCCTSGTPPVVTSIQPSSDGSRLMVTGQFSAAPVVAVNGVAAQVIFGVATIPSTGVPQGTVVVTIPVSLNDGNGVLTLCDQGNCSQTFFSIPPPPGTGGKG